jgi:predicted  nucleic acid-binding Zn ribbon protein
MPAKGGKPLTKETVVKCPKCGAEFQVGEGLKPEEKGH